MAKDKVDEIWEKWNRNPKSDKHRKRLFEVTEPIVSKAINTYAGGKEDPVISFKARELAYKAFKNYDPEKGKLPTHLYNQLQPLRRVVHERANPLKIPQKAWWDLQNLKRTQGELTEDIGHEPTVQQLADGSGLPPKRIKYLREFGKGPITESAITSGDPGRQGGLRQREEVQDEDWPAKAVYNTLNSTDQKIMEYRTGIYGSEQKPNKEIAKELGISAPAVSQRSNKIAEKLREALELER